MYELTLTWTELGRQRTQSIHDQQPSKNPGTVRIGRDPARCDLVLTDPTVSGLHVEIFFHPQQHCFYLRSLRPTNPPLVDGQNIIQGEVPLRQGSHIYLGQTALAVTAVSVATSGVPPTIVMPPQSQPSRSLTKPTAPVASNYGLECPHCRHVSSYAQLNLGCPWCGTSLAAAVSVVMMPAGS